MQHAVDTSTGETIHARQALRDRHRYRCPYCGMRVLLAGGSELQTTHFRHTWSSYATDCPAYHAANFGYVPPSPVPVTRANELPGYPDLIFFCRKKFGRLTWGLTLTVPNAAEVFDWCDFEDGRGRRARSYCKWLKTRGWRFSTGPQREEYRVECGGNSTTQTLSVPGLGPGQNLFLLREYEGRRIYQDTSIVAGTQYAYLTTDEYADRAIEGITHRLLGRFDQWNAVGFSVNLPVSESAVRWCLRTVNRRVVTPRAELNVVYPPRYIGPLTSTPTTYTAILLLKAKVGYDTPNSLVVRDGNNEFSVQVPLWHTDHFLASFAARSDVQYSLIASGWKTQTSARPCVKFLAASTEQPAQADSAIIFRMKYERDVEVREISIFDPELQDHLSTLSARSAQVEQVIVPSPVPVIIETELDVFRVRPGPPNEWNTTHYSLQVTETFAKALTSRSHWFRLDAGPLGTVEWGKPVRESHPVRRLNPSRAVVRQLRWILGVATSVPGNGLNSREVFALLEHIARGKVKHEELRAALAIAARSCPQLTAHIRAVSRVFTKHPTLNASAGGE